MGSEAASSGAHVFPRTIGTPKLLGPGKPRQLSRGVEEEGWRQGEPPQQHWWWRVPGDGLRRWLRVSAILLASGLITVTGCHSGCSQPRGHTWGWRVPASAQSSWKNICIPVVSLCIPTACSAAHGDSRESCTAPSNLPGCSITLWVGGGPRRRSQAECMGKCRQHPHHGPCLSPQAPHCVSGADPHMSMRDMTAH